MNIFRSLAKKIGLFKEISRQLESLQGGGDLQALIRRQNALLCTLMMAHKNEPQTLFALSQCLYSTENPSKSWNALDLATQRVQNSANLLRYLEFFRPFVSPNLKLKRVGGAGDGGYGMIAPECLADLMRNFSQNTADKSANLNNTKTRKANLSENKANLSENLKQNLGVNSSTNLSQNTENKDQNSSVNLAQNSSLSLSL